MTPPVRYFAVAAIGIAIFAAGWQSRDVFRQPRAEANPTVETIADADAVITLAATGNAADALPVRPSLLPSIRQASPERARQQHEVTEQNELVARALDQQFANFGGEYPNLVAAANDGNARAAKRLNDGLHRCAEIPHMVAFMNKESPSTAGAEKPAPFTAAMLKDLGLRLPKLRQQCAGITDKMIAQRWVWQHRAAELGGSMDVIEYLTRPQLNPADALSDPTAFDTYRSNAIPMLEAQIQQGNALAFKAYVNAGYDAFFNVKTGFRFHDALSRVLKPDPVRIYAYHRALLTLGDVPGFMGGGVGPNSLELSGLAQRVLTPLQLIEANALAERTAQQIRDARMRNPGSA